MPVGIYVDKHVLGSAHHSDALSAGLCYQSVLKELQAEIQHMPCIAFCPAA